MADDRWECDFPEFIRLLQGSGLMARNRDAHLAFNQRFRKELAFVSLYLNDLLVVGGEVVEHPDAPASCDFCCNEISKFGFFVDGATKSGEWANMCPDCYAEHGTGIGWGIGQLYRARRSGQWLCIVGGNPNGEAPAPGDAALAAEPLGPGGTKGEPGNPACANHPDEPEKLSDAQLSELLDDLMGLDKAKGAEPSAPLGQAKAQQRARTGPEPDWVKGLRSLFEEGEDFAQRTSKSD